MYDTIIRNGKLVSPNDMYVADVAVKGEKIVAIGNELEGSARLEVNAAGKYVLPGAIDVHTHLAMAFGGTVSADGYFSGTRAAACGGVTTVFDYAVQRKGKGLVETVEERRRLAEPEACVDIAFHCAVTNLHDGALLDEFPDLVRYGVPSLKVFMVYKKEGLMIDDGEFARIMLRAREHGMITNVHAENPYVLDVRIAEHLAAGKTSAWYHYLSRPEFVEAEAVKRAIHWASSLGTTLYIVHLAAKEGLDALIAAKNAGHSVYAETCPHYLAFTNEVYKGDTARQFVCSPPIKGPESRDALWKALNSGYIDTVATDHCPFQSYEKDWGKDNFTKIPNGCAGIENLYPFMLSAANEGRTTFNKVVQVCAATPARLFGCENKGSLRPGADADIVIYDPHKDFTISAANMHSDCDHTIWEGVKLHGYPEKTYSRGRLVYDSGNFVGEPGWGRYLARTPKQH